MFFTNTKSFEEFKSNEKFSQIIISIIIITTLIAAFLCKVFNKNAYQLGFFIGLSSVMIIYLVKSFILSKDEKKLKEKYIETYDERNQLIQEKAAQIAIIVSVVGIGVVSSVISIFNMQVAITLGLTCVAIYLIYLFIALVIRKKI